jgi:hypothetical protein
VSTHSSGVITTFGKTFGKTLGALCTLVSVLWAAAGCQRPIASAGATTTGSAATDSVRGVLTLVGSEPGAVLVIAAPRGGGEAVALAGAQTALLARAVGVELVAFGRRTGTRNSAATPRGAVVFNATSFVVRAVDGVPATDGVVVSSGGVFSLRLADGRVVPAPMLPASLRRMVGARVWLAGALDATPQSYGVIADR